ncbi:hypothetical protein DVK85_03775 [Flavobacterium arcticum]|uniref:Uncharacterized protein n=1 Tax=Flavobacterium arcticum TaxID=1784713 RepID=A0A345H9Y7_9FLAO|nr:hypothetical protein [Flavobacterium arcticum]AXG73397.1 hypothetical protein DVK85_03775 [Flavobacterium arcticum]KAF2512847.1 hypothetical protein E0W72_01825 [Flavobacterium arcticum]
MREEYLLDKNIWTEEDFDQMGWHDANIYGFIIRKQEEDWTSDLLLDIDYIFKWVNPHPPNQFFTFWVAPCTLVFKECFNLKMDIGTENYSVSPLEISDFFLIKKIRPNSEGSIYYECKIELHQGEITFESSGFEQIVKENPKHINSQVLGLEKRGGINFGLMPCSTVI